MNAKLEKIEKKLNIANDIINELEISDDFQREVPENLPIEIKTNIPEVYDTNTDIFDLESLKSDFMLIRQNVLKLIATGQRFMETVSVVDPADLKASQIQAISGMHETLGNNLKLLIDLYKQIADIEVLRNKQTKFTSEANQSISTGNNITNNQIVFAGSSDELLKLIKENQTL